uniref:uncharacterized protein LOC122585332 n=1 Tax=Erigeron canadensis TaxID=72917 RepID=UPI001CB93E0B|nr:uncharacterized protein LOC122585332 [Erigeron canadensis]
MKSGVQEKVKEQLIQNPYVVEHSKQKENMNVDPVSTTQNLHGNASTSTVSYANVVKSDANLKKANFLLLMGESDVDGVDLLIPLKSVLEVNSRFSNSLYGYFLGDRLAYPVVENYVKNAWAKFGLRKGWSLLERGPWMIRSNPIFLKEWTPNVSLAKQDLTNVPVWVKMYDVPLAAYTEDGLCMLASKLGKPILLHSYSSQMCLNSWGRHSYARALIELDASHQLKNELVVGIPNLIGEGFTKETVSIEHEWQPPHCEHCKVFGHANATCPVQVNKVKQVVPRAVVEDEFVNVNRKKGNGKSRQVEGLKLNKPKPQLVYRQKQSNEAKQQDKGKKQDSRNGGSNGRKESGASANTSGVHTSNPFDALSGKLEDDVGDGGFDPSKLQNLDPNKGFDVDSDDNEVIYDEKVLESHVRSDKLQALCAKVFWKWRWTSNGNCCVKGPRILLEWNPELVDVMVVNQTDQVVHSQVIIKATQKVVMCSFIYAHNHYVQRRSLWEDLIKHKSFVNNCLWVLLGDFNAALNIEDKSSGSSTMDIAMRDFKACVEALGVQDVNMAGLQYTWTQKPKGISGLLKKIDQVLANLDFFDQFIGATTVFQPYRISDHALAVLRIPLKVKFKPKPFKFSNLLVHNPKFKDVVAESWNMEVNGHAMYRLVKKLKAKKKPLRNLLLAYGNLHQRAFNDAILDGERFLKQKAKVEWLRVGDSNSAYFHKVVKSRTACNRIDSIRDSDGSQVDDELVAKVFEAHYTIFLVQPGLVSELDQIGLFSNRLSYDKALAMIVDISDAEIKDAIFSMGNDKSPGPDGYSTAFFKGVWDIVGLEVINVVRYFFVSGKLLKEVNHTAISLIPKVSTPLRILANRIKGCLDEIVSVNQSAFVLGRRITDNILLTHELMHNYHLDRGPPRVALKVDIQRPMIQWIGVFLGVF